MSTRALAARRLTALAGLAVFLAAAILVDLAARVGDGSLPFPPVVVPIAVGAIIAPSAWWITRIRWKAWGWELRPESLVVERGVLTRLWQAVPLDRIQFVEVTSGPLQRRLRLATLIVRTAGVRTPSVRLVDLDAAVAERLRGRLGIDAGSA